MKLRAAVLGSVLAGLVVASTALGQSPPAAPSPPAEPQKEMTPGVGWSAGAQSGNPEKTNTTKHAKKKAAPVDAGVPASPK